MTRVWGIDRTDPTAATTNSGSSIEANPTDHTTSTYVSTAGLPSLERLACFADPARADQRRQPPVSSTA